jgi:hypothetical protein
MYVLLTNDLIFFGFLLLKSRFLCSKWVTLGVRATTVLPGVLISSSASVLGQVRTVAMSVAAVWIGRGTEPGTATPVARVLVTVGQHRGTPCRMPGPCSRTEHRKHRFTRRQREQPDESPTAAPTTTGPTK